MILKPTAAWKFGGPFALLAMSGFMVVLLGGNFSYHSWRLQEWLVAALGIVFLASAIELPTKKLILDATVVRKRDWFIWRELHLPARVEVGRDLRGRVVIADPASKRALLTLTREFGEASSVQNRLSAALRAAGILTSAA